MVEQLKGEVNENGFKLGCEEVAALEKAAEGPLGKRIIIALINQNKDPRHPPKECEVEEITQEEYPEN
jgi:hypothetical protein